MHLRAAGVTLAGILWAGLGFAQIQNQPDDGQWSMAAKNYASRRFSTLDQINSGNVKNLKLAWTFSTHVERGHEAAPPGRQQHHVRGHASPSRERR